MSLLDDIRAEIGVVFSDQELFFSSAIITRVGGNTGWVEGTGSTDLIHCKAMIDTYSDHLRAVQDIPDAHVKLMILGAGLEFEPKKGDSVTIADKAWRIMGPVQKDPAGAVWTAQAAPV